jgi:DNA polymerase-3 subunit epsilon
MKKIDFPLKLDRPIVFFDLETTGTNIYADRIVEISVVKIRPDNSIEIKTKRVNPERPIPPEATAIHGIKDEDVANQPPFKAMAKSIFDFFEGCDLGGYNVVRFDIPLLAEEFKRANLDFSAKGRRIIDSQIIYHKKEPRDLSAALKFYCGKEMNNAHNAEADILATIEVFVGQTKKYDSLPANIEELNLFCNYKDENWIDGDGKFRWSGEEAVINFGKNQGIPLKKIAADDPRFLQWMIKSSFPPDAAKIAKNALIGIFPKKNEKK